MGWEAAIAFVLLPVVLSSICAVWCNRQQLADLERRVAELESEKYARLLADLDKALSEPE